MHWLSFHRHSREWNPAAGHEAIPEMAIAGPIAPERTTTRTRDMQVLFLGVAVALAAQYAVQWIGHTPWWQRVSRRFIWWRPDTPPHSPYGSYAGQLCCACSDEAYFAVFHTGLLCAWHPCIKVEKYVFFLTMCLSRGILSL